MCHYSRYSYMQSPFLWIEMCFFYNRDIAIVSEICELLCANLSNRTKQNITEQNRTHVKWSSSKNMWQTLPFIVLVIKDRLLFEHILGINSTVSFINECTSIWFQNECVPIRVHTLIASICVSSLEYCNCFIIVQHPLCSIFWCKFGESFGHTYTFSGCS